MMFYLYEQTIMDGSTKQEYDSVMNHIYTYLCMFLRSGDL